MAARGRAIADDEYANVFSSLAAIADALGKRYGVWAELLGNGRTRVVLYERRPTSPKGEAWLRRQLEGLGKEDV